MRSYPQKTKWKQKVSMSAVMKTVKQEVLIKKLNPILRGFANYYRGVVSKGTFSYIRYRVWKYLWDWCKRRHQRRKLKWVKIKYFRRIEGENWTFCCMTEGRKKEKKLLSLYNIAETPIVRHTKVKGTASLFDAELSNYWEKRGQKMGKNYWAKGSKYFQVAMKQKWKCPVCAETLFNEEEIETHHIVPVKAGGGDGIDNLVHLHKACHKQVHSKTKLKAGSMA